MGCTASKSSIVDVEKKPGLTAEQKDKIRESWARYQELNAQVTPRIYTIHLFVKLFEQAPQARELFDFGGLDTEQDMFDNPRLHNHAQKVTDAIDLVVKNLDDTGTVVKALTSLGERHYTYGVKEEYIGPVRAGVLYSLERGLGADFTDDVRQAWTIVFTEVIAKFMSQGMQTKSKQNEPSG